MTYAFCSATESDIINNIINICSHFLCGANVTNYLSPNSTVLCLLTQKSALCQFVLDDVHPPSVGLPFLLFLAHPSPSLSYQRYLVCLLITLSSTFLHFIGYFSHFCCRSNPCIPYLIQMCDSIYRSQLQYYYILMIPRQQKVWLTQKECNKSWMILIWSRVG